MNPIESTNIYYTSGQYWEAREDEDSRFKVCLLVA